MIGLRWPRVRRKANLSSPLTEQSLHLHAVVFLSFQNSSSNSVTWRYLQPRVGENHHTGETLLLNHREWFHDCDNPVDCMRSNLICFSPACGGGPRIKIPSGEKRCWRSSSRKYPIWRKLFLRVFVDESTLNLYSHSVHLFTALWPVISFMIYSHTAGLCLLFSWIAPTREGL